MIVIEVSNESRFRAVIEALRDWSGPAVTIRWCQPATAAAPSPAPAAEE